MVEPFQQDIFLVGEVPEECPLRYAGPCGYLFYRDRVEAAFQEHRESGLTQFLANRITHPVAE
jgi:uncharacterized protein YbcC (UPF0753/DUF2309 family)